MRLRSRLFHLPLIIGLIGGLAMAGAAAIPCETATGNLSPRTLANTSGFVKPSVYRLQGSPKFKTSPDWQVGQTFNYRLSVADNTGSTAMTIEVSCIRVNKDGTADVELVGSDIDAKSAGKPVTVPNTLIAIITVGSQMGLVQAVGHYAGADALFDLLADGLKSGVGTGDSVSMKEYDRPTKTKLTAKATGAGGDKGEVKVDVAGTVEIPNVGLKSQTGLRANLVFDGNTGVLKSANTMIGPNGSKDLTAVGATTITFELVK